MKEQLSILDPNQKVSLATSKEDIAAIALKAIGGIVPFGGTFSEILTTIIPNQKTQRVIDFLEILDYKISNAERKIEESELKTEEFADLLEDAIGQASRALTRERLEYLANLVKNGITDEALDHLGKKKLLSLLSQLNDSEIIWLKSYSFRMRHPGVEPYKSYYETHKNLLEPPPPATIGNKLPIEITNKKALRDSYLTNLESLGLIQDKFDRVKEGEVPKFDDKTGKVKSKSTSCTDLGRLLLDHLDLLTNEGND